MSEMFPQTTDGAVSGAETRGLPTTLEGIVSLAKINFPEALLDETEIDDLFIYLSAGLGCEFRYQIQIDTIVESRRIAQSYRVNGTVQGKEQIVPLSFSCVVSSNDSGGIRGVTGIRFDLANRKQAIDYSREELQLWRDIKDKTAEYFARRADNEDAEIPEDLLINIEVDF